MSGDEGFSRRPTISALPGSTKRFRRGHPWLFSNEIRMDDAARAIPNGTIVTLQDAGGEALGVGSFNPHSLISFRCFDRDPRTGIDAAWFHTRLRAAGALRQTLFDDARYCRISNGEADGLPGLILDRFGDVCVAQANTAGMDRLIPVIEEALALSLAPATLLFSNTAPVRRLEGLEEDVRIVGATPGPLSVVENGFSYRVDLETGQKTGWFYDQRPNRAFVAGLSNGRTVLDVCTYAGGFGLLALHHGAISAVLVDRSESSLDLAGESARAAGLADRLILQRGDAFASLEEAAAQKQRFGVVVCDPPAFAKSRKDVAAAAKAYRKMARLGAGVVEAGGFLFIASCSHHMAADRFYDEVVHGLGQAGRAGRLLRAAGAGPDHPVHPQLPESVYLKTLTFQLD